MSARAAHPWNPERGTACMRGRHGSRCAADRSPPTSPLPSAWPSQSLAAASDSTASGDAARTSRSAASCCCWRSRRRCATSARAAVSSRGAADRPRAPVRPVNRSNSGTSTVGPTRPGWHPCQLVIVSVTVQLAPGVIAERRQEQPEGKIARSTCSRQGQRPGAGRGSAGRGVQPSQVRVHARQSAYQPQRESLRTATLRVAPS